MGRKGQYTSALSVSGVTIMNQVLYPQSHTSVDPLNAFHVSQMTEHKMFKKISHNYPSEKCPDSLQQFHLYDGHLLVPCTWSRCIQNKKRKLVVKDFLFTRQSYKAEIFGSINYWGLNFCIQIQTSHFSHSLLELYLDADKEFNCYVKGPYKSPARPRH